jgi:anti-sigma factor RsiW
MNCLSKEELTDYLFAKDAAPGRAAAEAHIAACAACRAEVENLKRLKAAVGALTPAPVSGEFTARLMREIKAQAPARKTAVLPEFLGRLFSPAWSFSLAALAVALIISTAYLAGRRGTLAGSPETLTLSDGPATVNKNFSAEGTPGAGSGYVFTDSCATAKCGVS